MKRAIFRGVPAVRKPSSKALPPRHAFLAVSAVCLLLGVAAPRASALIVADNLDKPEDGVENVTKSRWLASKFQVGNGSFFLTEATLRLLQTAGGRPEVALYTDAGGKPGQLVGLLQIAGKLGGVPDDVRFIAPMSAESFSSGGGELFSTMELPAGVDLGDFDGDFTASGSRPSGLPLAANGIYWLVVRSTGGEFAQVYTDQEKGSGPGFSPEWADSTNSGKGWTNHELSPLLYRVDAEEGFSVIQFRIDNEAIVSAIASGLPMALIQRETLFAAAETAVRDVNARLFRLRSEPHESGKRDHWEVFVAGNYSARDTDAIGLNTGFNADVFTSTAGVEFRPFPGVAAGGAFTWVESDNALGRNVGDADIQGTTLSAYLSGKFHGFYADLLYSYGAYEHQLRRNTLFNHTARGNPDSYSHTLALNLGGNFEIGGFVTGPFGSMTYVTGDIDGYEEKNGGTANVRVADQNFDSLVSQLGWQISREINCRGVKVTPQVRAAWSHEFRNRTETLEVSLVDSPFSVGDGRTFTPFGSFQVAGDTAAPGTDAVDLGATVRVDCGERCSFFVDYSARLGRTDQVAQFVSLTASVRF